jgi:tRNA pseudouridine55 synthase
MTTTSTPDGLLLVDKPAGVSSHDLVLAVRRAVGERRVGHAGTLDPFATGLLVMLVGRATRLLPFLPGDPKVYEATIAFGSETDTEDFLGAVIRSASCPSRSAVIEALPALTGTISQVPPAYSAKRVGGRRAYALARRGGAVILDPVPVRVHAWEPLRWSGDDTAVSECHMRISCGAGTYVRALARELGRAAGSAAHLLALRRVRSGPFDVAEALSLEQLRERVVVLRPALDALPHLPRQSLSPADREAVVRGVDVAATIGGERAALVNAENGVLVALGERLGERWQPRVVMRPAHQVAHSP